MSQPTPKRILELLRYEPESGNLFWLVPSNRWGRTPAGAKAGTLRDDGRTAIYIDGKIYLASRLAFVLMTGRWPTRLIDHVDGNKGNDRWLNLREADKQQNSGN